MKIYELIYKMKNKNIDQFRVKKDNVSISKSVNELKNSLNYSISMAYTEEKEKFWLKISELVEKCFNYIEYRNQFDMSSEYLMDFELNNFDMLSNEDKMNKEALISKLYYFVWHFKYDIESIFRIVEECFMQSKLDGYNLINFIDLNE